MTYPPSDVRRMTTLQCANAPKRRRREECQVSVSWLYHSAGNDCKSCWWVRVKLLHRPALLLTFVPSSCVPHSPFSYHHFNFRWCSSPSSRSFSTAKVMRSLTQPVQLRNTLWHYLFFSCLHGFTYRFGAIFYFLF